MNRVAVFLVTSVAVFLLSLVLPSWTGLPSTVNAQSFPSDELLLEAEFVAYYTNLQRRSEGLAPLKLSKELTQAALLFAEDAVVNLGGTYCGHLDSLNRTLGERLNYVGMNGAEAFAENVVCGDVTPDVAVELWMDSEGHRRNILTDTYTEIGVGKFVSNGTAYGVQDFAFDPGVSPLIINNEAPSTLDPAVDLYLYDHFERNGLTAVGPAVEMMIANTPDFAGASWQPFSQEVSWHLEPGSGWRTVYALTRDADGRRVFRRDQIYLGDSPVIDQNLKPYPSVHTSLTRQMIVSQMPEAQSSPLIQVSLDWEICESDNNVQITSGVVDAVADAAASGGQAQRMSATDQNAYTILWTQEYIPGQPMIGYVRLKVDNNEANSEILHLDIRGDGVIYSETTIKGSDFHTTNRYQEFPIEFTVPTDYKPALVEFHVRQTGSQTVYFDGISFYTNSMPFDENFRWETSRPAHRSRGLLVRTVTASGEVSTPLELVPVVDLNAADAPVAEAPAEDEPEVEEPEVEEPEDEDVVPQVIVEQSSVELQTEQNGQTSIEHTISVSCRNCAQPQWIVESDADWVSGVGTGDQLELQVNAAGLAVGEHTAHLTVFPSAGSGAESSAQVIVVLTVSQVFMPVGGTEIAGNGTALFLPITMN